MNQFIIINSFCFFNYSVFAIEDTDIFSNNALLVNMDTDEVLFRKSTNEGSVPIASLTKVMTYVLAVENIEGYFPLLSEDMPNTETFMLKVKGESMINAGIFDGDYVLVEQCNTARNGDMVVALVDDSATVKTFYKEDGYYRLQPENDSMDPILVFDCQILGKVIGVFRFL